MATPVFDDIEEARAAGFTGEYHVHWRLEMAWADPDSGLFEAL